MLRNSERDSSKSVAVIGAGAGGLSAAKYLLEQGVAVTVFELGSQVGGLWVYENDNGRSPAYDSLHINSEANVTSYPDFPFPPGTAYFPSHRTVRAYLEAYADHFDIRRHIRFNTEVVSVRPADPGWGVGTSDGSEQRFDAVVIATGHQAVPAHPHFAGNFSGEYLHSHEYRTPDRFTDRRVLVVGTGNSALDIASDICTFTTETICAARSPVLIMPRTLFGVPTARVVAKFSKPFVPWSLQRRLRELLTWVAHGRMEQWGLVTPKSRTHPASHPTFMSHVTYDRIKIRPDVAAVEGTNVHFTDGSVASVDVIIAATGYEIDLPFLPEGINPVVGRRLETYKRVVHPDWPGLYFVGFFNVSGGANIRMMAVQAEWVAALVTGRAGTPTRKQMLGDIEREKRRLARRYPAAARYGLELDPKPYVREIARELKRPSGGSQAPEIVQSSLRRPLGRLSTKGLEDR